MLWGEKIALCFGHRTQHIKALWAQNAALLNVKNLWYA